MLKLNIIPNDLKKDNAIQSAYLSIRKIMLLVLLFLFFYTAILYGSKFILHGHFQETINEANLLTKNTENYSKQVGMINAQINSVESIQTSTIYWSYLIEYFASKLPVGIKLDSLRADKTTKTISLSGVAGTRDQLLMLKSFLESNNNFSEVSLPIKTLLEKENISFSIQLKYLEYDFVQQ